MTALADVRLVCLAPDAVVPPANGSAARTVGLAAAVRPHLAGVTIHSFSPAPQPAHGLDGLDVVHIQTPTAGVARARYLAEAMLGPALGFRFPRRLDEHALVQLESPLLFEAARRAGLGRFILDAHNVYQDMAAFPQASLGDRVFYRLTRRRQARMEAACWARAAHVIFCSAVDRDRAERLLPGVAAKSSIVPNCVDVGRFTPRPPAAFARGGPVLFMGTTRYPPNFFAIQEICRDVAPALPDLEFHIVGDAVWAPAVVPPNVRFLGRVESTAEPLAAAQVAIAPVRHGSGTRLKLLEYFAAGLPVVCTAKAAEGIAVEDGRHLRLVDTPTEMVAAVRALHADAPACAALGAAARALVRERYDWRAQVPGLLEVYAARASD
ncbi:MAG TPA: glycosyltransferase family 4 protein [Candidatus Acidoferrum sp.]|jgi:glycosyltransferase involved in cell wall biosynthesis|nr:glycosyltransferase family 4 protein [Candidatus Acidoferrum sp.]